MGQQIDGNAERCTTHEKRREEPVKFGDRGPGRNGAVCICHERGLEQRGDKPRCYDKLAVEGGFRLENEDFSGHQNEARDVRDEDDQPEVPFL